MVSKGSNFPSALSNKERKYVEFYPSKIYRRMLNIFQYLFKYIKTSRQIIKKTDIQGWYEWSGVFLNDIIFLGKKKNDEWVEGWKEGWIEG